MNSRTSLLSWRLKPNIWICRRTSPRANSSHRTEFGTSRLEQFLTGLTWKELALGLAHKQTVLTKLNSKLAACEQFLTELAMKTRSVNWTWRGESNQGNRTKWTKLDTKLSSEMRTINRTITQWTIIETGVRHAFALASAFNARINMGTRNPHTCG